MRTALIRPSHLACADSSERIETLIIEMQGKDIKDGNHL